VPTDATGGIVGLGEAMLGHSLPRDARATLRRCTS
jgi:hypothetical protein